jgi:multidrug efflux pump subunit AcrA (membrane-fusion protein)
VSRRYLVIFGTVAVLLAGWWGFGGSGVPDVAWAEATRGDLVLSVEVNGTLQAVNSTPIGPPQVADVFDFKIAMMAPEGKDVTAGTPVLGFDVTELERKLLEKKAESESARRIPRSRARTTSSSWPRRPHAGARPRSSSRCPPTS